MYHHKVEQLSSDRMIGGNQLFSLLRSISLPDPTLVGVWDPPKPEKICTKQTLLKSPLSVAWTEGECKPAECISVLSEESTETKFIGVSTA